MDRIDTFWNQFVFLVTGHPQRVHAQKLLETKYEGECGSCCNTMYTSYEKECNTKWSDYGLVYTRSVYVLCQQGFEVNVMRSKMKLMCDLKDRLMM